MGLFGDKKPKKLSGEPEMTHMTSEMTMQMPKDNVGHMTNASGSDILAAASAIGADGRRDEAVSAIESARVVQATDTGEAHNQLLDQVLERLPR